MKINILTFLLLWGISLNSISQITKLKLDLDNPYIGEIQKYDSLENINCENAKKHIGQTIYLKENNYSKKDGVYFPLNLRTDSTFRKSDKNLYKSGSYKNTSIDACSYEQLKGKSFYVNRLLSNIENKNTFLYEGYCLELIETTSKDIVYLYFRNNESPFNHFMTLGYFEKLKQLYIGKDFYYLNNRWNGSKRSEDGGLYDLKNGNDRKDIPKNAKLKCIDVSIEDGGDNNILIIFDVLDYGKSFAWFDEVAFTGYGNSKFETFEEHRVRVANEQKLMKKYGEKIANIIINGEVRIGFTKQMCIESLGEPIKINKTSATYGVHEQWVYNSSYLYFENGILKTIQK